MIVFSGAPFPFSDPALGKDLGVQGAVWSIGEDDLLLVMEARARAWGANGGLERYQREMTAKARGYVETPPPVRGLRQATETSSRLFDPSVETSRDLTDHEGRVFARAGQRVNPLDYVAMSRDLVFIDGRRPDEVAWALKIPNAKVVLVAGAFVDLQRTHGRRFYFDQKGLLTQKLALQATPSHVTQEGLMLRITEIGPDDLRSK